MIMRSGSQKNTKAAQRAPPTTPHNHPRRILKTACRAANWGKGLRSLEDDGFEQAARTLLTSASAP